MAKQLNEREKFLNEIAVMKKVGLILLDLSPAQRETVMKAVMAEVKNPSGLTIATQKRKYTRKKKAAKKTRKKNTES